MLPELDEGGEDHKGLQGLAIDLVRCLGSHSITVAQLKKIFRLMQPLPASEIVSLGATSGCTKEEAGDRTASVTGRRRLFPASPLGATASSATAPLQPPWLCALLRALRGMMDDRPGPQRFFLLNGISSGLRLPPIPRWPAPAGYTFCAWVRLDEAMTTSSLTSEPITKGGRHINVTYSSASVGAPVAAAAGVTGAPCLFSFCGERGQGVAACFIPLRKGRTRERPSAALSSSPKGGADAEPQQYSLEVRVGAGRKRPPAVVRFPGAIVTAGAWVFVAVSHAANRWGQRGEVAVLVDNCWRVVPAPFPRFRDGGVPLASVACHCPPHPLSENGENTAEGGGAGARIVGRPGLCNLKGQVRFPPRQHSTPSSASVCDTFMVRSCCAMWRSQATPQCG